MLEPVVTFSQELIVTDDSNTMEPMVTNTERDEFSERLNQALDAMGVAPKGAGRQTELARLVGLSQKGVRKWLEGESLPDTKRIPEIAKKLGVREEWLLFGRGQMKAGEAAFAQPEVQIDLTLAKKLVDDFVLVPRYNVAASMGPGAVVDSEQIVDYLSFKRSWIERERFNPENLALIDSRGDSMSPTLNPGDLLLIDHSPIDRLTNGIYVINIDGDLLAKRVERQLDGSLRIISDNPKYPPQVITDEDAKKLTVVGKVVWAGGRM